MIMRKTLTAIFTLALFCAAGGAYGIGQDSVAVYGTYWDGENAGYGGGVKYDKSLLNIVSVDGRAGYIMFDDDVDTSMIPLEVAFNLGWPGAIISPYIGVGLGYYLIDHPLVDDTSGYFGQLGLEFKIIKIGAMVELRYMDLEEDFFDDLALNAGIVLRF